MNPDISISIVVPAFNEEENLEGTISDLLISLKESRLLNYEIIIVDDGSSDKTGQIADQLAAESEFIQVIHHPKNLGVGSSIRDGYKLAQGEYLSWFPGDAENQAEEFCKGFKFFSQYDIIVPYIINPQVRGGKRRLLSAFFNFIVNLSFGTSFRYTNGLVIYRREIFGKIKVDSTGFFFQTEALIKAVKSGYNYVEVAQKLKGRENGQSKALTSKSLFEVVISYLRLVAEVYVGR